MSITDLMQGSKVTGQISPKVLGTFREIRNILEKQHRENALGKFLHTELINWAAGNPCCFKNGYRAVYPQLIQKHDHPLFVVLDERIHSLHVWLLQHKHNIIIHRTLWRLFSVTHFLTQRENPNTLAPNSTRLAKFCTDFATRVSVRPAVEDGGSAKTRRILIIFNIRLNKSRYQCWFDFLHFC